jgi:hypothetical protein
MTLGKLPNVLLPVNGQLQLSPGAPPVAHGQSSHAPSERQPKLYPNPLHWRQPSHRNAHNTHNTPSKNTYDSVSRHPGRASMVSYTVFLKPVLKRISPRLQARPVTDTGTGTLQHNPPRSHVQRYIDIVQQEDNTPRFPVGVSVTYPPLTRVRRVRLPDREPFFVLQLWPPQRVGQPLSFIAFALFLNGLE